MRTLEERLKAVEDELSIRNLAARFSDAVNERDLGGFRQLWTDDAVWEIGPPLQSRAEGVDEIVAFARSPVADGTILHANDALGRN